MASLEAMDWQELTCESPPGCEAVDCAGPFAPVTPTCQLGAAGLRECVAGPTACEDHEQDAANWLARHQECGSDSQCTLVNDVATCLQPFLCSVAVRAETADVFRQGAMERASAHMDACTDCTPDGCVDPAELEAVCEDFRCTVRHME